MPITHNVTCERCGESASNLDPVDLQFNPKTNEPPMFRSPAIPSESVGGGASPILCAKCYNALVLVVRGYLKNETK